MPSLACSTGGLQRQTGQFDSFPLQHLYVCPDAARTSRLLYSRTAEPLEVACWEELDVTDAVHSHRRESCASCKFVLPAGQGWQRQ